MVPKPPLQAEAGSPGRQVWARGGKQFPILKEHREQNSQVIVKSSDSSESGAAEIPQEDG